MTLEELLRLAQETLNVPIASTTEFIEKIAQYSAAFAAWGAAHADILSGKQKPSDEKQFRLLAETHSKIIDRAEALKGETGKDLNQLRKKGKGIMAYTDILPKRISMSGTKKG